MDEKDNLHGLFDEAHYTSIFGKSYIAEIGEIKCIYTVNNGKIVTGPGASFGGISLSTKLINPPRFNKLRVSFIALKEYLFERHKDISSITIRLAPDIYYPVELSAALRSSLELSGAISVGEVNYIISKKNWKPKSSVFRNCKKAFRAGYRIRSIKASQCFDFLSKVKGDKGYEFGFTKEKLIRQVERFPKTVFLSGSFCSAEKLSSAIIEVRLNNISLLVSWDQDKYSRKYSAIDQLLLNRIENAFNHNMNYIDLGTVTINREINEGLIRHKENFGACPMLRNTFIFKT